MVGRQACSKNSRAREHTYILAKVHSLCLVSGAGKTWAIFSDRFQNCHGLIIDMSHIFPFLIGSYSIHHVFLYMVKGTLQM